MCSSRQRKQNGTWSGVNENNVKLSEDQKIMASRFNHIWNNNWHLMTPVVILILLFLYILIPGNIENNPSPNEIESLLEKKNVLKAS